MKIKFSTCLCAFAVSTFLFLPVLGEDTVDPGIGSESIASNLLENASYLSLPVSAEEGAVSTEEEFSGRFALAPFGEKSEETEENKKSTFSYRWSDEELKEYCSVFLPEPLQQEELLKNLPKIVELDIEELRQEPELPTGCESVALTIALRYKGYDLDKTTIAEEYLVRTTSSNFIIGYVGDPFTNAGMGVYPPGLLLSAQNFLETMDSETTNLRNLTGTDLRDLFSLVAMGEPVILWASMYMSEPQFSDVSAYLTEEVQYNWYYSEHCMVLCGYNLKENTVTIDDPLEGIVTRNFDEFNRIFEETGKLSAII